MPSSSKSSAITPRRFWKKQFHGLDVEKDETRAAGQTARKAEPEGDEEGRKPRRIEGLGEQAYWVGDPITGPLYDLQGDNFVRIIAGGLAQMPRASQHPT